MDAHTINCKRIKSLNEPSSKIAGTATETVATLIMEADTLKWVFNIDDKKAFQSNANRPLSYSPCFMWTNLNMSGGGPCIERGRDMWGEGGLALWTEWQIHTTDNITFPQLCWRALNIVSSVIAFVQNANNTTQKFAIKIVLQHGAQPKCNLKSNYSRTCTRLWTLVVDTPSGQASRFNWWHIESHLSGWFWLFVPKFWEVVGTYEWYFVILWMLWMLCTQRQWGYKIAPSRPSEPLGETFTT